MRLPLASLVGLPSDREPVVPVLERIRARAVGVRQEVRRTWVYRNVALCDPRCAIRPGLWCIVRPSETV
jgi:hypothetical protein